MSTWARTPTGDMVLPRIGSGVAALVTDRAQAGAIKLQDRFRLWLGEWFLDTRIGFPWLHVLGVKSPDLNAIRQLLRTAILATPPIAAVDEVAVTYNSQSRGLSYTFRATTDAGAVIVGGSGIPFIVTGP